MTEAAGVVGMDRLPWLADEPPARKRRSGGRVLPAAFASILVAGGAAYWLGLAAFHLAMPTAFEPAPALPSATVPLPAARTPDIAPPQPQRVEAIEPMVAPALAIAEPAPAPAPHRAVPQPPSVKRIAAAVLDRSQPRLAGADEDEQTTPAIPQLWPVHVIDGASGRLVRIGTFASTHDAKQGWSVITRVNPAMEHIPALVVPVRSLRDGEVYYRLQMGTTSQAHSTVLCQRMRMIAQSCVILGLGGDGGEVAI